MLSQVHNLTSTAGIVAMAAGAVALLALLFCAILGVILIIFPWRDEWTTNRLLLGYPGVQDWLASGFVRGLCSGLGVLDIWIGFWEAIHYHE